MKSIDKEGGEWLVEMDVLQPNLETRTMKTAVEQLIERIDNEINKGGNGAMAIGFDYGLKKAKQLAEELLEIEKERLEDAYRTGIWDVGCRSTSFEEYYNRTFKQQEQ